MFLKKIEIGNVKLNNNVILAPMAGITDLAFRTICEKFNPGLVVTEMISSKAIFYNDEKTKKMLNMVGEKRPISVQIFGSDEESMGYAARYISEFADIIDINMGCPAPKVVKNGDGSKLLLDLNKCERIIKEVVKKSKVPVTLKIRSGWDKENIVAHEVAKIAEENGISAITIHGRTRSDFFSGKVDLEIIKKVKEAVRIPVIGNGNIIDEFSAKEMLEYTGVDGIMVGRATLGNPWLLGKIIYYLETGDILKDTSNEEKIKIIKKHIELEIKEKGEYIGIREMRKHIFAYTKNMPYSSEFRTEINKIENKDELIKKLDEYFL